MTPPFQYKLLLGIAGALLAASGGWFGWQETRSFERRRSAAKPVVPLAAVPYAAGGGDAPAVTNGIWGAPPAQRRGKEWIYEVFTPPEIFYDARTGQFSVSPPSAEPVAVTAAKADPPTPFGIELIGVKRTPFRVQLVGFVGGEGNYRGLFENTLTSEMFLAARGHKLTALGLTIEDFEVRRQPWPLADSMTTHRPVATAVLRDERTDEKVTLTDRERCYLAAPLAVIATADGAMPREVREGDRIQTDATVYRIDRIQFVPPAVEVTKVGADQRTEQRKLTVAPETAAAPTPPRA